MVPAVRVQLVFDLAHQSGEFVSHFGEQHVIELVGVACFWEQLLLSELCDAHFIVFLLLALVFLVFDLDCVVRKVDAAIL